MRNRENGITLIALIITIIVMLILVGVVVTVVIQSDLLGTAKTAGDKYKTAYEEESKMSGVTINGKKYESIEEYMEEINPTIVEPDNIDDWNFTVEDDGTVTLTLYEGTDTEVTIPNYVNGKPVKTIKQTRQQYGMTRVNDTNFWSAKLCGGTDDPYYFIQRTITKVNISHGIENIGKNTFKYSRALEEIKIPSTVTKIEELAFYGCASLKEITIPSSVKIMGSNVFDGTSITVHVSWKEGEKPEGWADDWAGDNVTIDYVK